MNKLRIKTLLTSASASLVLLASCSPKLQPFQSSWAEATPEPLELVAGTVPTDVSIRFPERWFHKKANITITPVLRFAGRKVAMPSQTYRGEHIKMSNAPVVSYAKGALYAMRFAIPFEEGMEDSELFLEFDAKIGTKQVPLAPVKIGEGTITTAGLADLKGVKPIYAPDHFSRVIKEAYTADIQFLIQQAEVRAQELNKKDVQEWIDVVENAHQTPKLSVDVEVQAYASPDGGKELNEKLSEKREKNTTSALKRDLGRNEVPMAAYYTAQDWDGFKELLEKSSIPDKDLVLRVLNMYTDPEEREREIKNISFVFKQLADEILPKLRRSRLVANVEIMGRSDEDLVRYAINRPARLRIDELLYAATLIPDLSARKAVYEDATRIYPEDYRPFHNLGTLAMSVGAIEEAEAWFDKAEKVQANSYTRLNRALIALDKKEVTRAESLIGNATDIEEVDQVMALLYMTQGKYDDALRYMGNVASDNAAVAKIMVHRYQDALETLQAIAQPTARTHYLKAVALAHTGQEAQAVESLREAIRLDAGLRYRAMVDREFRAIATNEIFRQLTFSK